jgi:hypothetical protein
MADTAEFISIPEWSRRIGVSKESAHKAARLGVIPGCSAIGTSINVSTSSGVGMSLDEIRRDGEVGELDRTPHFTAWRKAVERTRCRCWTEIGSRPSLSHST